MPGLQLMGRQFSNSLHLASNPQPSFAKKEPEKRTHGHAPPGKICAVNRTCEPAFALTSQIPQTPCALSAFFRNPLMDSVIDLISSRYPWIVAGSFGLGVIRVQHMACGCFKKPGFACVQHMYWVTYMIIHVYMMYMHMRMYLMMLRHTYPSPRPLCSLKHGRSAPPKLPPT